MDWHVEAGLTITLVEAPDKIQDQKALMAQTNSLCAAQGISTEGNAAGNTADWLNLTGQVTVPPINHG